MNGFFDVVFQDFPDQFVQGFRRELCKSKHVWEGRKSECSIDHIRFSGKHRLVSGDLIGITSKIIFFVAFCKDTQ